MSFQKQPPDYGSKKNEFEEDDEDEDLVFALDSLSDDNDSDDDISLGNTWKVLVIDDEPEVHKVTRMALSDMVFKGKSLEMISGYTGAEAIELLKQHPDTALVLLDVVMETDDAGLKVVDEIRQAMGNKMTRIILRTGQPGLAPEESVVMNYDINDYKSKADITSKQLSTSVISSLRSFHELRRVQITKVGLMNVLRASASIFHVHSIDSFAPKLIKDLERLAPFVQHEDLPKISSMVFQQVNNKYICVAGNGDFENSAGEIMEALLPEKEMQNLVAQTFNKKSNSYSNNHCVLYITGKQEDTQMVLFLRDYGYVDEIERTLFEIFCANLAIAHENTRLLYEMDVMNKNLEEKISKDNLS